MDKFEKVTQRARGAMIQFLVMFKQPPTREATLEAIKHWEKKSYRELSEAVEQTLQRAPYANKREMWYMQVCIGESERVRDARNKVLEELSV